MATHTFRQMHTPPLMHVFFSLAYFVGLRIAYVINTLINLLIFPFAIGYLLKLSDNGDKKIPLYMLFVITSYSSYGFQFELERGQFNLITMSLCFLSVYIFHSFPEKRLFAYVLFALSVQLKIYPIFLVFLFISDHYSYKINIIRVLWIVALNYVLFYSLGYEVFSKFINSVISQASNPYVWVGNMSTKSYSVMTGNPLAVGILSAFMALCLLVNICLYFMNTDRNMFGLLMVCTICTMLVPAVSHDYKLSYLSIPALLYFSTLEVHNFDSPFDVIALTQKLLIIMMAALYASTLYSFEYKPLCLKNNLPALVMLLGMVTIYSLLNKFSSSKLMERSEAT